MDYITEQDKFPKTEHFAALVFDSIYIPGDERSRTNPGHGYPESRESIVKYITFKDKEEMTKWVTDRENPRFGSPQKNYKVISSKPLSVSVKVDVSV